MKHLFRKMQERFKHQFNHQYPNAQASAQEGKVTIKKTKSSGQAKSSNVGDYVDFEEVEE
tara:strand:+ start:1559 stop:1738 length:180 start_codon:yes stop_codon:yes gene_type:complete